MLPEPEMPAGWQRKLLGQITTLQHTRAGKNTQHVVLSSTKHRGLVPSEEYFNRQVFSDDLANYRLVARNWFAYATNHLTEGSIGLQREYDAGLVSPIYTVFSTTEDVEPRFLIRLLKTNRLLHWYKVHDHATVDRRGAVRYSNFAQIPIDLPPLAEQRAIAGILDAADDAIARARAAAEAARRAKRGLVQQFFEAGLGRVSCADSPNATLAKGWQLVRTDKLLLAEPKNGISPTTESAPPGFITFSIAAVRDGRVDLLNREHWKYARISADVAEPYRLNRGDILVVRGNANPDLVGKCGIVDELPADCIYPDILKRVHFDTGPNGIDPRFAEIAWNHAVVHNQVLKRAKTSNGTLKINSRDVKQIVMPLPPRAEQERFVALLTATEERIRATERCVAAHERLKRGLMQVLLTGRVRVPVAATAS